MAQIRVRVVINKGRTGAPLEKLGDIARQFDKFMRSLVSDLDIRVKENEILAVNFKNGSVAFDTALQVDVDDAVYREFNRYVEFITDYDPESDGPNGLVSDATLLEFSRIGESIDPDEEVGIGLYGPPGGKPGVKKWRQVSYRKAIRVRQALERPITSYGSVQGAMHSLVKEVDAPFFRVRESASDNLIKCLYRSDLYPDVVDALRERNAVVHATGYMSLNRAKRAVEEMRVERIDKIERLSDDEFRSLFGSVPGITGEISTNAFIRNIRDDG